MFQDFLKQTFLGNIVESYCWFLGIILLGLVFKKIISKFLSRLLFKSLKKYSSGVGVDKFLQLLTKPFGVLILLIIFFLAFDRLEFPSHWNLVPRESFGLRMILFACFQIAMVISLTWIILRLIDFLALALAYKASLTESKADDQLVPFIREALKIMVIILSFFFILGAIFHLNIASLIAGLGIGGLAIALAAKESLENLLGSFTIFFDKPFVLGDLVQVGNITGNVEKIGFRSTRIRTLEKSFVTVPNKKMVDAELDNLTLRTHRRVNFTIHLTYETSAEQLKAIIADIKKILNEHTLTSQEERTVHLTNLGNSALEISILYYVNSNNAAIFMQVKEEINFKIIEIVKKYNSHFAFPSTTVYLQKQ